MEFKETKLRGVFVIEPKRFEDDRGFFAQSFSVGQFAARGLTPLVAECNISYNRSAGTLRGMHFQRPPHAQAKLVRCTRGSVFDVAVDLRPESPTFKEWVGVELTAENRRLLFIPEGFAHGYQTLEDDTEVFYQVSDRYAPDCADGVRWDDPAFRIAWPDVGRRVIIARDAEYPDFEG